MHYKNRAVELIDLKQYPVFNQDIVEGIHSSAVVPHPI